MLQEINESRHKRFIFLEILSSSGYRAEYKYPVIYVDFFEGNVLKIMKLYFGVRAKEKKELKPT